MIQTAVAVAAQSYLNDDPVPRSKSISTPLPQTHHIFTHSTSSRQALTLTLQNREALHITMTDSDQSPPPPPSSPPPSPPSSDIPVTWECISWDRSDPAQKELSNLINLKHDLDLGGIVALGRDGVMRSLTADRRVVDAVGLTPAQLALWMKRWPQRSRSPESQLEEGADGTKVPREQWFHPPEGILPSPMSAEARERMEKKWKERDRQDPGWLERAKKKLGERGVKFAE